MIESISIKNVATYDPVAGVQIDGLKKVNFIYGANGTGKTTITKLLSNKDAPEFSSCSVSWTDGMPLQSLVYNRDFRERNFASGNIDGVFTLGEATAEEKVAIEVMVKELGEIKAEGLKKKETLERLKEEKQRVEDAFRDTAWEQVYKKYETVFKDAFAGVMRNKLSFMQRLLEQAKNNQTELNPYELLWRELKNHEENDSVTLQNTMRRIIENYFNILGKYDYKDLFEKFEDSPEEHEICRSLVSWINDGSHTIPDDLFIQTHDDSKDKYLRVFEQIFVRMDHYEHYKMMMGTRADDIAQTGISPS